MIRPNIVIPLGLVAALLFQTTTFASFPDVPTSHPNYDAIQFFERFITGYPDGTFKPGNTINRAEFVKILVASQGRAFAGNCALESAFPDVKASDWFSSWACHAKVLGYVAGYPDGTFRAANAITFAEAAKILAKYFQLSVTSDANIWYKGYVDALAIKNAIPLTVSGPDAKLTRGETAELIYRLHSAINKPPTYEQLPENNLVILEWGIQFTKPRGMTDLLYAMNDGSIKFITQQLMDLDASTGGKYCTLDDGSLGSLSRLQNLPTDGPARGAHVHIGNYYYFFEHPQATCGMNEQVTNLQSSQAAALQSTILKNLRAMP